MNIGHWLGQWRNWERHLSIAHFYGEHCTLLYGKLLCSTLYTSILDGAHFDKANFTHIYFEIHKYLDLSQAHCTLPSSKLNTFLQHTAYSLTFSTKHVMFNRPGVAGAVLQTPASLIKSVAQSSFSSKSSKHHNSQTVWPRELTFWENVHPTQYVMCHLSHVTCHLSCVTCHLSHVTSIFCLVF